MADSVTGTVAPTPAPSGWVVQKNESEPMAASASSDELALAGRSTPAVGLASVATDTYPAWTGSGVTLLESG